MSSHENCHNWGGQFPIKWNTPKYNGVAYIPLHIYICIYTYIYIYCIPIVYPFPYFDGYPPVLKRGNGRFRNLHRGFPSHVWLAWGKVAEMWKTQGFPRETIYKHCVFLIFLCVDWRANRSISLWYQIMSLFYLIGFFIKPYLRSYHIIIGFSKGISIGSIPTVMVLNSYNWLTCPI